ncbi:NgoBV family restriction endonuclease [Vibrio parahaemolyticus]|uniref:NgoBV family restriction endonuclease n=1 Tax=Vibrio parahaemolyticus TaxID=670 RepID=UPI00235F83D9|nr:NgoBV family restriction endonuclease [Vibrio parahaemolyticus]EHR7163801.1 NgoBV family restriction endonuclease [Vibrio parahaemolyticus]ELB2056873.1 NgoBV family restriction endonuclease [Vibrio parahaemolyticus]
MNYHPVSIDIYNKLSFEAERGGLVGGTQFTLGQNSIFIASKDGIGKLIEEWLGIWAIKNGINISPNLGGQSFPDFYINPEQSYLEIKTFDLDASPNFDVANFESYCESVSYFPQRLNADYIILGYRLRGTALQVEKIWLKKIWEICCPSERFPLKVQAKRDVIYNIRPANWFSPRATFSTFCNPQDFINALYLTQKQYLNIDFSDDESRFYKNIR